MSKWFVVSQAKENQNPIQNRKTDDERETGVMLADVGCPNREVSLFLDSLFPSFSLKQLESLFLQELFRSKTVLFPVE